MKDTTKRQVRIAGSAIVLLSFAYNAYKASKNGFRLEIEQDFNVPARDVIDLISKVELETEFVPLVSRVDVIDRQNNEVTYEVGSAIPVPWRVVYTKWWDYGGKWVAWKSLIGTLGVSHRGEIKFEDTEKGCKATLISTHNFSTPLVGGAVVVASEPAVWGAMRGWMKRLASAFEKERVEPVVTDEAAAAAASSLDY